MHTKGLMASRGKVRKGREREEEEGRRGGEGDGGGGGRPGRKREVGPSEIIRHICKRGIVRFFCALVISRIAAYPSVSYSGIRLYSGVGR